MLIKILKNPINKSMIKKLKKIVGKGPVLITTHHNPDPDGLASGIGIAFLLQKAWNISSRLVYTGIVARAENRAMLKYLADEWEGLEQASWEILKDYPVSVLVDTQPGSGNNQLPKDHIPQIVFDHHTPIRSTIDKVPFVDIRIEIGAVSTMVFQYLEALNIVPDFRIATALFYGLKTDTMGLSRGRSKYDEYAYFKLLSCVDHGLLSLVENAQLPLIYYQAIDNALRETKIYGKIVISKLGNMHQPDLPAEIADLLIRLEGIHAVLCMGVYRDKFNVSIRLRRNSIDAGELIDRVVGDMGMSGGHHSMAGGQIDMKKYSITEAESLLIKNFLKEMNETGPGIPLLQTISQV